MDFYPCSRQCISPNSTPTYLKLLTPLLVASLFKILYSVLSIKVKNLVKNGKHYFEHKHCTSLFHSVLVHWCVISRIHSLYRGHMLRAMGSPGSTVYLAQYLGKVLQLSLNLFPHLWKQLFDPIITVAIEIQWGSFSHKMVKKNKTKQKPVYPLSIVVPQNSNHWSCQSTACKIHNQTELKYISATHLYQWGWPKEASAVLHTLLHLLGNSRCVPITIQTSSCAAKPTQKWVLGKWSKWGKTDNKYLLKINMINTKFLPNNCLNGKKQTQK